jgi:hypothetical protein
MIKEYIFTKRKINKSIKNIMIVANKIFTLTHCVFIVCITGFSTGIVMCVNSDPVVHQCLVLESDVLESNPFLTNIKTYVPTWKISFQNKRNKTIFGNGYLFNIPADPKYLYFFYLAKLNKKIQYSIARQAKYSYFS